MYHRPYRGNDMSTPNTAPVALRRDLHVRIKRLMATMTLAGSRPPTMFSFVNTSIETS